MNWYSLPPHIVERIVELVIMQGKELPEEPPEKDDEDEDEDDEDLLEEPADLWQNYWLMTIRNMASVCNRWSDIIFSCKRLFELDKPWPVSDAHALTRWCYSMETHIQFDTETTDNEQGNETATILVKEGFLRYAKVLWISDSAPEDAVFLVRDHAKNSGVTKFKIVINESWNWTVEHWNALTDIMRQSKPKSVYIHFTTKNQADAVLFWSFLMALCHACGDAIDWLYCKLDEYELGQTDWSFIGNLVYTFEIAPVNKFHIRLGTRSRYALEPFKDSFNYAGLNKTNVFDFLPKIQGWYFIP